MRSNLLSLQNTQGLMDMTQERLSTGKKVNSAIDNPSSYYTAQSLNNRASDLSALLDSMGQAVQTIKAANEGIETITAFAEQAKAVANTALDTADVEQIVSSQKQFNELLKQIDQLADDAGYKGINLLEGDELTVTFNEGRTSTISIQGEKADSKALGITEATNWDVVSETTTNAEAALDTAQAYDINTDTTVTAKKGELDTKKGALDTAEENLQDELDGANNPATVATLTEARDKAQAEYQKIVKNLEEAKQSGDLIQVTKNNIKKDDAQNDLDWAQYRYDNLNHFKNIFWWHCFGFMFLAVWFAVSGLVLAFTEDPFSGTAKIMLIVGGVITLLSLIFGLFVSWRSLLTLVLLICNILIFIKRHY